MTLRRIIAAVVGLALLLSIAGLAGGAWYLSDQLKDGALVVDHTPPQPDLEVAALSEGQVTLRVTPQAKANGSWAKDGTWGLTWEGGYGQVGAILDINNQQVVREFAPMVGAPRVGEMVRLDSFTFPGDPQQAFGLAFQEVAFSSPLGEFPAWFVDGSRDTWVIFVHGKGASRREALRMLPAVVELGFPSLIITYRNDEGLPASENGFYRYGQTEWEDVQGAAAYAIEHGAKELVLVGYSMGGAIVANFLYQSPLAERVKGAILDSPMINFSATIDLGIRRRGYPMFVATIAKAMSSLRFGVDWEALNYLKRTDELAVPILLFHGDADTKVPVETSDALAEARLDLVTYVRVAGTPHVGSWNTDSAGYKAAVRDFLRSLTARMTKKGGAMPTHRGCRESDPDLSGLGMAGLEGLVILRESR